MTDVVTPKPSIFAFGDLLEYLTQYLSWRRSRRASFSFRGFARQMGGCSHTMLQHLLAGRRRPSRDLLERLLIAMDLNCEETSYARILWHLSHVTGGLGAEVAVDRRQLAKKLYDASHSEDRSAEGIAISMIVPIAPERWPIIENLITEFQAKLLLEAESVGNAERPYQFRLQMAPSHVPDLIGEPS